MKKTYKAKLLAGSLAIGLGVSLVFSSVAFATTNQVWSADSTVTLGSNDYTILSGSESASFVVGSSTITVNVDAGDVFTFRSSSRFNLNNDQGVTQFCAPTYSELEINGNTETDDVIITPDTTSTCSNGGSGGGGGGGGGTPSTPATPTTPTTPAATTGSSAVHPNGTLVLDGTTIYLLKDGKRYGFRNADEYKSHGYNFNQAVPVSSGDLALPVEAGNIVKALEGTLVLDASDNRTVYMVGKGNTKRGFASAAAFSGLGYSFANLPKINLSDYAAGTPINSSSEVHPEGALVRQSNGTVWWILGGTRQGFESMAVFNTYGFPTSRLVPANSADLALSEGALVKFRDGTLVKDGNDYYLISEGKKLKFVSTTVLTSRGYSVSNAITASLTSYTAGEDLQ